MNASGHRDTRLSLIALTAPWGDSEKEIVEQRGETHAENEAVDCRAPFLPEVVLAGAIFPEKVVS